MNLFAENLFKLDSRSLRNHVHRLYELSNDHRHAISLYIQCQGTDLDFIEPKLFEKVPNITFGPALFICFNSAIGSELQTNAKEFIKSFLLSNEFSMEAMEIYMSNLVFWLHYGLKRDIVDWQLLLFSLDLACQAISKSQYSGVDSFGGLLNVLDSIEKDSAMELRFKDLLFELIAHGDGKPGFIEHTLHIFANSSKLEVGSVNDVDLVIKHFAKYLSITQLNEVVNKSLSLNIFETILKSVLKSLVNHETLIVKVDSAYISRFLEILINNGDTQSLHLLRSGQIQTAGEISAFITNDFLKSALEGGTELGTQISCWLAQRSTNNAKFLCEWADAQGFEGSRGQSSTILETLLSLSITENEIIADIPKYLKSTAKGLCKLEIDNILELFFSNTSNENLEVIANLILGMQLFVSSKITKRIPNYISETSTEPMFLARLAKLVDVAIERDFQQIILKAAMEALVRLEDFNSLESNALLISLHTFATKNPDLINSSDNHLFGALVDSLIQKPCKSLLLRLQNLKVLIESKNNVDNVRVFNLCVSNDSFPTLITGKSREGSQCPIPEFHEAKPILLKILQILIARDPKNCCQINVLKVLIKNYYGSKDESDLETLKLMKIFERETKESLLPFIGSWGEPREKEHFQLSGASLSRIDSIWMAKSLHWFDFNQNIATGISESKQRYYARGLSPVYDPAFFLLFAISILDCEDLEPQAFLDSNLFGMCLLSLSSESLDTRKVGHHVVSKAFNYLQNTDFKERNSVTLLLDIFRNGIDPKGERFLQIPSIMTQFVAKGLMNLCKPESHFYPLVNRFCLQRDSFDMEDVPMFYEQFYSSNEESRKERNWLLKLLLHGMNSRNDFRIFRRRHAIDILIGYYSSENADTLSQKLIIQVLLI